MKQDGCRMWRRIHPVRRKKVLRRECGRDGDCHHCCSILRLCKRQVFISSYSQKKDAAGELRRVEGPADARKELEKVKGENPVSQKMIRAI